MTVSSYDKAHLGDVGSICCSYGIVTLTVAGQTFGRRMPRSCRSGRVPSLLHRLGAELTKCAAGDQMALRVEGVVDGGVGGQKSLR
jgi:hypothetical protein